MTDTQPSNAERAEALEQLLIEGGYTTEADIDRVVDLFQSDVGPLAGTGLVARAWSDPEFKRRLLDDATAVLDELDISGGQAEHLVVVENTPQTHNVVVCTLCSCYPWAVLGLPPAWYKDPSYRSRVVREPRTVLAEMGLDLSADTEIRVWDSSSEVRYMVLPERPAGTDDLTADELAALVNRDSMIGVARAGTP